MAHLAGEGKWRAVVPFEKLRQAAANQRRSSGSHGVRLLQKPPPRSARSLLEPLAVVSNRSETVPLGPCGANSAIALCGSERSAVPGRVVACVGIRYTGPGLLVASFKYVRCRRPREDLNRQPRHSDYSISNFKNTTLVRGRYEQC